MSVIASCSACGSDLYEMDAPFVTGDVVEVARLRPLAGVPQPMPGAPSTCPVCGVNLIPMTVATGWLSHGLRHVPGSMIFHDPTPRAASGGERGTT